MDTQYNVYFAGELLPDQDPATVREKLRALFKASDATLEKLFSGKPQLIKRQCDKATALKYKQALEKAGARPVIKRLASEPEAAPAAESPAPAMTMAERVAALAEGSPPQSVPPRASADAEAPEDNRGEDAGMTVAPAGSDVLRPDERSRPAEREVDTSALSVAASGERLSEPAAPPPAAPDTSHMSMAGVGEDIPNLPRHSDIEVPDTSAIDLAPEGSDFSDCAPPPAAAPALDLSAIEVAPEGSDVLEEQYRRRTEPAPPDTSHIALDEP